MRRLARRISKLHHLTPSTLLVLCSVVERKSLLSKSKLSKLTSYEHLAGKGRAPGQEIAAEGSSSTARHAQASYPAALGDRRSCHFESINHTSASDSLSSPSPLQHAGVILEAAIQSSDCTNLSAAIHAAVKALGSAEKTDAMLPEVITCH